MANEAVPEKIDSQFLLGIARNLYERMVPGQTLNFQSPEGQRMTIRLDASSRRPDVHVMTIELNQGRKFELQIQLDYQKGNSEPTNFLVQPPSPPQGGFYRHTFCHLHELEAATTKAGLRLNDGNILSRPSEWFQRVAEAMLRAQENVKGAAVPSDLIKFRTDLTLAQVQGGLTADVLKRLQAVLDEVKPK